MHAEIQEDIGKFEHIKALRLYWSLCSYIHTHTRLVDGIRDGASGRNTFASEHVL